MLAARSAESAPSLAEQAYRVLEDKLVNLELAPGSVVSEGQLIRMTGLGRTPVREAMQRLAQQELFQVLPRKGLLVAPVNLPDILHVLEARKPLERVIVYRASLNARDEQRSGLASIARDLAIAHDDCADGHFSLVGGAISQGQRQAHPVLVVEFRHGTTLSVHRNQVTAWAPRQIQPLPHSATQGRTGKLEA